MSEVIALLVDAFDFARAGEKVTGVAPLVAECATQIAGFRGNDLYHRCGAQLVASVTNGGFKVSAPSLHSSPPTPVEAGEMKIIARSVTMVHSADHVFDRINKMFQD